MLTSDYSDFVRVDAKARKPAYDRCIAQIVWTRSRERPSTKRALWHTCSEATREIKGPDATQSSVLREQTKNKQKKKEHQSTCMGSTRGHGAAPLRAVSSR